MFNTFNKGRDMCISKNNDFGRPTLFSYSLIMFIFFLPDTETQCNQIIKLLQKKEFVTLPEIMKMGIAWHTARISDLRKKWYNVQCIKEYVKVWKKTVLHTKYTLIK